MTHAATKQEPRRWTLHNQGDWYEGEGEDETVSVIEASAYDALLAENDALKAELVTERRWAERMKSPELLRTVLVNQLADQIDALKAELAALKEKAERLHDVLRGVAVRSLDYCGVCHMDEKHGGHAPDCPAAPDFLTTSATESREAKGGTT